MSIEQKLKIGSANKKAYASPILRKQCSDRIKRWLVIHPHPWLGRHLSEETKLKISKIHKGKHLSEEHKRKISKNNLGRIASNETKEKMRNAHLLHWGVPENLKKISGKNHHSFGKKFSEDTKRKQSEGIRKAYAEGRLKVWCKGLTKETDKRVLAIANCRKGKKLLPEQIAKLQIAAKKRWENKEYIEKLRQSMNLKPNKQEKILIKLFEQNNLPYKFVGDWSFVIGRKCPDFVNVNGEKKVIELFGTWWHKNKPNIPFHQTEEGTKQHYAKFGWGTLIIWERELANLDSVLEKIKNFEGR